MDKLNEINELFNESQPSCDFLTTEYSFVVQGVPITNQIPEELVIAFANSESDFDISSESDERQLSIYEGDTVDLDIPHDCTRCNSPEARWVGVKIFTKYNYQTKESRESGVRVKPYCNECLKMPSENRPGPNYVMPRTGHLIGFPKGGNSGNASWGLEADDESRGRYWSKSTK